MEPLDKAWPASRQLTDRDLKANGGERNNLAAKNSERYGVSKHFRIKRGATGRNNRRSLFDSGLYHVNYVVPNRVKNQVADGVEL